MKKSSAILFILASILLVTGSIYIGLNMPQWLLKSQIHDSLDHQFINDAYYSGYPFAQNDLEDKRWGEVQVNTEPHTAAVSIAKSSVLSLMSREILPMPSSTSLACEALYRSVPEDSAASSAWKVVFLANGTNCRIEYTWDEFGFRQISLTCDPANDVVRLPEPVIAVSINPNSSVFSLGSDVAFSINEETKEAYCIRSQISNDILYYDVIRTNP